MINQEGDLSAGESRPGTARHRLMILAAAASVLAAAALGAPLADAASNGVIAFQAGSGTATSLATVTADGKSRFAVAGAPAGSANVAWGADGTRLAFSSPVAGINQIFTMDTMDTDGMHRRQVTHDPVGAIDPTWSPDGTQLAFASYAAGLPAIAIVDLQTGTIRQITSDAGFDDRQPQWSPDGKLIAFVSDRTGRYEITTITPSGTGETTITTQLGDNYDPSWSPGGSQIAYTNNTGNFLHIEALPSGGGTSRQVTLGGGSDAFPSWSPDGTQIAFSRGGDLYVVPESGETLNAPATFVSGGATDPAWGPAPTPVVVPVTGQNTTTKPDQAPQTVTTRQPATVGTTVNSTSGTSLIVFKPLTTPLAAPEVRTTVQGGTYTVVAKTPDKLTLKIAAPVCARRGRARTASLNRTGAGIRVHVHGGHVNVVRGHVFAGSKDPPVFAFISSCAGTTVRVQTGVVQVRITGIKRLVFRHGHSKVVTRKRTVVLHGGQTGVFVTRGRFAAATVRG